MSGTEKELEAGPELDRLVAVKMGYPVYLGPDKTTYGIYIKVENHDPYFVALPDFSGNIESAWRVINYMSEDDSTAFTLTKCRNSKLWEAEFDGYKEVQADTAPLAICRAFLALPDLGEKE